MPKLALGIICGNIAPAQLQRFYDQFSKITPLIATVFAPGCEKPDAQLVRIADKFGFVSLYINRNGHDWPHVDDFAAARNQAFQLARDAYEADWLMWADTDDLIAPEAAKAIVDFLASPKADECDMIQLPYRIPYQSVTLWRERIVRAGKARWESPVHEFLAPVDADKPLRIVRLEAGLITHAPDDARDTDGGRNLRILESIPAGELTTSHRYHLCQEHLAVNNVEKGIQFAIEFVQSKDAPPVEVYDTCLSTAQVMSDAQAHAFRQTALALCPERREAYYEIALSEMKRGRAAQALAWVRAAEAQPMPSAKNAPWNLRQKLYGWAGVHLRCMIERANGLTHTGDAREFNFLKLHGAKISLIHATRGRPEKAMQTRQLWLDRAKAAEHIEHIFVLDEDDEESACLDQFRAFVVRGNGGPVEAWNAGAAVSIGEVIVQLSDDWEPPQDWDAQILAAIGDTKVQSVLRVSDGTRTDGLLCMAICTRSYFKERLGGELFDHRFFSMYSDNWFTEQAERSGAIIDASEIVFRHNHPAFGRGEMDATYARSNSLYNYAMGWQLFQQLKADIEPRSWRDLDGWGAFGEQTIEAFEFLPPGGKYVEVGVAFGRNLSLVGTVAAFLENTGTEPILVIGIDHFKGDEHCDGFDTSGMLDKCRENIKSMTVINGTVIMQGDSADSANEFEDGSVDVVFIDADHSFDAVKRDILAWLPKVRKGGLLYGHDIECDDVKRALSEIGIPYVVKGECWWHEVAK